MKQEQTAWKTFQQGETFDAKTKRLSNNEIQQLMPISGVKESKNGLAKHRADGKLLTKEAKAKLEAEATFLLYQTYLQTNGNGKEKVRGFNGRDEH